MTDLVYSKVKYTAPSDDSALTISLDGATPLLCSNWIIDLTLSKGMHLPGMKGRKLFDVDYKTQRRFLTDAYKNLFERIETCNIKIDYAFIVYEIQKGTLNVHSHANVCLKTDHDDLFVQRVIIDILKHMQFKREGIYIQGIMKPEDRKNYLLKKDTKVPPYVTIVYKHVP